MTDAMHWSPDPPSRPEPLLRIDVTGLDPDAAQRAVDIAVGEWWRTSPDLGDTPRTGAT